MNCESMRELAESYRRKNRPWAWFEIAYQKAEKNFSNVPSVVPSVSPSSVPSIPWYRAQAHPLLMEWFQAKQNETTKNQSETLEKEVHTKKNVHSNLPKALVIGSGLGDDAELVSIKGFETWAFDVSKTAILRSKERFPHSKVHYRTEDLFDPPKEWIHSFDFVLEIFTLQALPIEIRKKACSQITQFLKPNGELLLITLIQEKEQEQRNHSDNSKQPFELPWPLNKWEFLYFEKEAKFRTLEKTERLVVLVPEKAPHLHARFLYSSSSLTHPAS